MVRYSRACLVALMPAALLLTMTPAHAGSSNTSMLVTALSVESCLVSATPMAFGTLQSLSGQANDSAASITVTCTPGSAWTLSLDDGLNPNGGTRRMKAALSNDYVPYMLYSDSARTRTWGHVNGTDTVSGTAGLLPAVLPVYGRVPGNIPAAPIGSYADTVTVTIAF